jgi:hypothetical protein
MPGPVKPKYQANPAHNALAPLPNKTAEPKDAEQLYNKSAIHGGGMWYAMSAGGEIYRYSPTNDGTVHFSGMTGGKNGIRLESIPIDVRRTLGRVR